MSDGGVIRVMVVDDEPLAREGLVELLETHPAIDVVGAFGDGPSALAGIESAVPDALFVDVQMPGMSGFELVESLEVDPFPAIVFATAYDEYAIRAFEVNAVAYLLKPVSRERLVVDHHHPNDTALAHDSRRDSASLLDDGMVTVTVVPRPSRPGDNVSEAASP